MTPRDVLLKSNSWDEFVELIKPFNKSNKGRVDSGYLAGAI